MIDQSIEEFFDSFRQEYLAGAEANENYQLAEFMECVANEIMAAGDLEGYEFCHFDTGRGMRADGYWFDDEGALSLFIGDFDFRDNVEPLTQTEAASTFKRVKNFFQACCEKELWQEIEVTSPEYALARQISDRKDQIAKLRFFLASERRLSERVVAIESDVLCGKPATYHVWDISRLHRQRISRGQREPLVIDFMELFGRGIPCLPVNLGAENYKSFLAVLPGRVLADLYERYGARLLEQNVRAFLQNRGNVNKGIRATILNEPGMFFAYNNGITATAAEIELDSNANALQIRRLTDLQIVNGGQTTASLFHTRRNDKAPIGDVFVQMKLSVIDPAEIERVVPRIAEYANTQNRVNAADLFSNSPFHIRMEEISRRIFAPPVHGAQRGTKWFYERSRGQYADELAKRTLGEQKRFLAEYPKHQVFTKTDLAKFENAWDEHPRYVNLGAQKNFVRYAERIAKEWEEQESRFNEYYFRRAVVRGVIFRATERIVSAQPWYSGGYRANTVAYGIACIAEIARQKCMVLDPSRIWQTQEIPEALSDALKSTTEFAYEHICNPAPGVTNVTEWCKRDACWKRMIDGLPELSDRLPSGFGDLLVPREWDREEQRTARKEQVEVSGIQAQVKIMSISVREWATIRDRLSAKKLLTQKQDDILRLVSKEPQGIPSAKQSQVLIEVLNIARDEGVYVQK